MLLFRSKVPAALFLVTMLGLSAFAVNFKSCFNTNRAAAIRWPALAHLSRSQHVPTLVVFLHPHCHNSTATLFELEQLLPTLKGRVQIYITMYAPEDLGDSWSKKSVWRQATKMRNVNLYLDKNGEDSELFGAQSSGEMFLYDTSGDLLFHGGVTRTFGIAGQNKGAEALVAWLTQQSRSDIAHETPVWGRNLRNRISIGMLDVN